jgi:DNA-binding transcriptional MerR regulator
MTNEGPQKSVDALETKGHGKKTEAVRNAAVTALLTQRSIGAAARKAGVNERTLRRWLQEDAEFKEAYESARTATYTAAMSRIQSLAARAIETLEDLLAVTKFPTVRLGAARTIVEIAMHQHDAEAILKRIEDLEARQDARKPWHR